MSKPTILINPPPSDGRCVCCGKGPKELKPFGGPGDPLVGNFKGALLVKTFREEFSYYGQVGASWECRDCIILPNEEYRKKKYK